MSNAEHRAENQGQWPGLLVGMVGTALLLPLVGGCSIDARAPGIEPGASQGAAGATVAMGEISAGAAGHEAGVGGVTAGGSEVVLPVATGIAGASSSVPAGSGNGGGGIGGGGIGGGGGNPIVAAGSLASDALDHDFAGVELHTDALPFDWTISNVSDIAISALTVQSTGSPDFRADNGCSAGLNPGASCVVRVDYRPQSLGSRAAALTLGGAGGGAALNLSLTGRGQARLTVVMGGSGLGSVTSEPAGIDCGQTCSALFDGDVVLRADTQNGSNAFFSGWSDPACAGPLRNCSVALTDSRGLTATFSAMVNNLVFISSSDYTTNLGSLAAYDFLCNSLATTAGINNLQGDGFLAGLSTTGSTVRQRFGAGVQGWVRLDGRPFTASLTALYDDQDISYPIEFDEDGSSLSETGSVLVMTGTTSEGGLAQNCSDWTDGTPGFDLAPSVFAEGLPVSGPRRWTELALGSCDQVRRIVCFGRTNTTPLVPESVSGKRIWVTNTAYVPGTTTPDAKCLSERPAGVANARAFITYSDRVTGSELDPAANYVRPDGVLVGTGAQLVAMQPLTGIWVRADGSPQTGDSPSVWSGPRSLTQTVPPSLTCNDWSDTTAMGFTGYPQDASSGYFSSGGTLPCSLPGGYQIYCVEP